MKSRILKRLEIIDSVPGALKELTKSFSEIDIFTDNISKDLVKAFVGELYRVLTEATKIIESTLDIAGNNIDHESLKKIVKKSNRFLEENKNLFVRAGVATEEEINKKKAILINFFPEAEQS